MASTFGPDAGGQPPPRPHRRLLPALIMLVAMLAGLLVPGSTAALPAQPGPDGTRTVSVTGRGWGHGRGMGQYGAYGYAQDAGWSSAQILDHFYGGTSAGPAPSVGGAVDPAAVRVELRSMIGQPTTVALEQGTIVLRGLDDAELGRFGPGAVRLVWTGSGFNVETGPGCSGPWGAATAIAGRSTVRFQAESPGAGSAGLLVACAPTSRTWYEGELRAVVEAGATRTLNVVSIEQYLRGVVPNEMPASWPVAALEAQAVAARSYALAGDSRQQPYADTCDTILCQVYDGAYTTRGGTFRSSTHSRTDAAIAATTGLVRLHGNGSVARTEFSSSTGGHTAGGTFPAVADAGDAIAANPNRTWSTTVDLTGLEALYNRGRILSIAVVQRNGLGADGGRATRVELRFEGGTVSETGNTIRSRLGLKSDWFSFGQVVDSGRRHTPEGAYIDRTYQRLVGRSASNEEIDRWFTAIRRGDRLALTGLLVRSDYFAGRMVDDLYQRALGRAADPEGRAYWVRQVERGLKVEHLGVLFFGSREYHLRAGGTDDAFVTALYRGVLQRDPDSGGQSYWVDRLVSRRANLDDVAAGFYQSLESRRARAVAIHLIVRGVPPSETGRDLLADRLLSADDLVVAAEVAASPEA